MKPRILKIAIPLLVLLVLAAYFLYPRTAPAEPLPAIRPGAREAAAAVNAFAFDLYAQLRARPGNLCLSPYSIHTALAMAHEGAAKQTADQLAAALHLTPIAREGQRVLHTRLQAPGNHGFELAVANRLWLGRAANALPAYSTRLASDFLADAQTVDFSTPTAINTINAWASQRTHGRIPAVLAPGDVSSATALVLTNALYFKGNWDIPFQKSATKEGDFFPAPERKTRAMLMFQNKKHAYAYIEAAGTVPAFRALSLDYTGGDLAMLLLLPDLGQLDQLEAALTDQLVTDVLQHISHTQLPVTLPRFTITDSFSLRPTLESLGITSAFDSKTADFSNISPLPNSEPLFLSAVLHRTFIEVNEEGTEAAAVTVAGATAASAIPMKPAEFKADHPFLFLLRDQGTGAILFLGRFNTP
jgi:serpin B